MKYIISEQQFDTLFLSEQDENERATRIIKKYLMFKYPEINNMWFGKKNVLNSSDGSEYVRNFVYVVFDVNGFLGPDGPSRKIPYEVNRSLARKITSEVTNMFGSDYEVVVLKVNLEPV